MTDISLIIFLMMMLLVYGIFIISNIDNKTVPFMVAFATIILVMYIGYRQGYYIFDKSDTFLDGIADNPYFYLANMILALLLYIGAFSSTKYIKSEKILLTLCYLGVLLSLFIVLWSTSGLDIIDMNDAMSLRLTYYIGNMAALVMYLILISSKLFFGKKVVKHRMGPHV